MDDPRDVPPLVSGTPCDAPAPPVAPPESASPPDTLRRASYVLRHWRGALPLPMAYWVSPFLATLVIMTPFFLLRLIDVTRHARAWALGAIVGWLCYPPLHVWALVGIWRSAGQHPARGGSAFWAGAARTVTVIGWIGLASTAVFRLAPQVAEFSRVAFGASEIADSRVRIIRDGTEVEVNGPLGFGIAAEFRRALEAHPAIRVVHLNSNGGRIQEAMALARAIRDRRLVTYVATECSSACVTAFAGGEVRWLSHAAVIGLHSPSMPGVTSGEVRAAMSDERAFMVSRGVNESFLDRGLSTPSDGMWRPTHQEVFEAGLATGYAPAGSVGVSGLSARELGNIAGELGKLPVYAALQEADPGGYAAVATEFEDGLRRGRPMEEIRASTFPRVAAALARALPHASDAALHRFGDLLVAQGRALQEGGSLSCAALFSGVPSLETWRAIPKELRTIEPEVMAEVMLSAAREPQLTPDLDELRPQLATVLDAMPPAVREDIGLLDDPQAPGTQPDRYCATILAFYEAILARPDAEVGPLLRALFGAMP